MCRNPYYEPFERLGIQPTAERPLWQRRRGFGIPIGVEDPAKVPLARRRRPWLRRNLTHFEKIELVGEGTYGQVWSARDRVADTVVALKRIRLETKREGFPITAIREIKLLKNLRHENIVELQDVVTGTDGEETPNSFSIYLVFEYMRFDLSKLVNKIKVGFSVSQCKNIAKQILQGLTYCHEKNLIHRDLKCSNVLLDGGGRVKLADFGLAREFGEEGRNYTNCVVTLWYRCPELLLGATEYDAAVDMWSAGILIAEILTATPLVAGKDEAEQLDLIWKMMGSPNKDAWPNWTSYENSDKVRVGKYSPKLRKTLSSFPGVSESGIDLVEQLLSLDPEKRPTARQALEHNWFDEKPQACLNHELELEDVPPYVKKSAGKNSTPTSMS